MLTNIRVTKYNPQSRDSSGKYLQDEWTSFSDVGKHFSGSLFDIDQYYSTEDKYIKAVMSLFKLSDVINIKISGLEKYDLDNRIDTPLKNLFYEVENDWVVQLLHLPDILKLILREYIWCELESADGRIGVKFGYDYYMYFKSDTNLAEIVTEIQKMGLYVD